MQSKKRIAASTRNWNKRLIAGQIGVINHILSTKKITSKEANQLNMIKTLLKLLLNNWKPTI